MRISALEGRRVALWGFGREGRAALAAIRRRLPDQPLTLFCAATEADEAVALSDPLLSVAPMPDAAGLSAFDVVIKSPGISPYRAPADAARAAGVEITSGTALWFGERLPGLKACITGTKGKSTTTALVAHLLRSRGLLVGLGGNIGLPLLALLDPPLLPAVWAIELSSYQTGDAVAPDVAVVLNLYPEHLDWHGSEARYLEDKLALVTTAAPRATLLNWRDARLRALGESLPGTSWFGREDGWHVRDARVFRGDSEVVGQLPPVLPGAHNALNLCAALATVEALGFDAAPLVGSVPRYRPLPHRLQWLGRRDGVDYIDDSIATTPHASLAALDCLAGRRVAIIVGGFERGIDWAAFAERCRVAAPAAVICTGQNGPRIHAQLAGCGLPDGALQRADDFAAAVAAAQVAAGADGVVLLSPGAPSFPDFRDYAERGRRFAELAGFDAERSSVIPGLGIA